jgi:hypothetical protein
MGIEPTLSAWEAEVLPLNYTRFCCYGDCPDCIKTATRLHSRMIIPARYLNKTIQVKSILYSCLLKTKRARFKYTEFTVLV